MADYLSSDLSAFIDALAEIDVRWIESVLRTEPFPDDAVWVGRSPAKAEDMPDSVLVLNNKAADTGSVMRLATLLTDEALARWPPWRQRPMAPQDVLNQVTLVVEDASPDSVWGVIVLLARVAGCDFGAVIAQWLAVIERWEQDGTARRPGAEWPALAAALAHAQIGPSADRQDADYQAAWTAMLRFAAECVRRRIDPLAIGDERDFPLLDDARNALGAEEQAYRVWLSHAHMLQLSLPVRHTNGRRLLVDALLFTEDEPTGASKTIYRNDLAGSPLGHGFTFAASWRPSAAPGSGDDITIAVDPRRGVHLMELWAELERLETVAWDGTRPSWKPRHARLGPANEPWWLTEDATLIAAPRAVPVSGAKDAPTMPGSRLTWTDIPRAIWRVCNPLRGAMVTTLAGESLPLLALPREQAAELLGVKSIRLARWHVEGLAGGKSLDQAVSARALAAAPVVDRVFAALAGSGPSGWVDDIGSLPVPGSWTKVDLAGGFAIVVPGGVLILDDWREEAHPDLPTLRDLCVRAAALDHHLRRLESDETTPLVAALATHLSGRGAMSEKPGLAVQAARIAVRLAELRGRRPLLASTDGLRLQDALDREWGLNHRLTAMEQQVRAVSESLKALGDARMRRVTQLVALIGFPFYFALGLAKPVALGVLLPLGAWAGWWAAAAGTQDPSIGAWWMGFVLVLAVSVLAVVRLQQRDPSVRHSGARRRGAAFSVPKHGRGDE